MRLLQLAVPSEDADALLHVVDEHGFGHTLLEGTGPSGEQTIAQIVAPADAVEHVLVDLEEAGLDTSTFTVSLDAEFARFEAVDEVQNRWGDTPNRLAPATLRSKAKDLRRNTRSFLWMMALSAIVATAGLLLGSPAVVVGSMVIAPIVSPVLTASVGTVRNDRDMLLESLHMQALGLAVAIATAGAFAWLVESLHVVPADLAIEQMQLVSLRLSPSVLALAVGLAAGAAGAFGLATEGQVTIVGVMIAAALIPTAAATGLGIAWGKTVVALGSLLLLLVSVLSVNVGGTAMLFYLEYRPDEVDQPIFAIDDLGQGARLAATLGLTVVLTVLVGALFVQQSSFERSVDQAIGEVLDREAYRELAVEETAIEYRAPFVSEQTTVTVQIARVGDPDHPGLAADLAQAIGERTGHEVRVHVTFVDYRSSDPVGGS